MRKLITCHRIQYKKLKGENMFLLRNFKYVLLAILILATVLLNIGCEEPNANPVITSLTADPSNIETDGTSTITCIAFDPDGDDLTYSWHSTAGKLVYV